VKETCEGDEVAFQCALMLRSPCREWLESNDMGASAKGNPPQIYPPTLTTTQYGILAPKNVSSVTRSRTVASNLLYLLDVDKRLVRLSRSTDSCCRCGRFRGLAGRDWTELTKPPTSRAAKSWFERHFVKSARSAASRQGSPGSPGNLPQPIALVAIPADFWDQ